MKKKEVLLIVGAVLALSCCAVIGPWVLVWAMFVAEDAGKERALRGYSPTSLADAVAYKYATPALVAKFIDRGEDVNQRVTRANGVRVPLISVAAGTANVEVARLLIKRGARVDEAGLWSCVRNGSGDMARMLIEEGASLGPQPDSDEEIGPELIQAAAFGHQVWLIQAMLAKGADLRVVNKNGAGLLALALETESMAPGPESNSADTTRALLAAGADANAADHRGTTPLHWAAHRGKVAEMRMLLAAGAALEARTVERATPLGVAVEQCQPEAVALLLSSKASMAAVTPRGVPLSEGVCAYGYPALTKRDKERILALLRAAPS